LKGISGNALVPVNQVGIPRRVMSWSLKKVMDIADAADGATWWENDGMSCSS
jgi:hypothetical protein